MKSKRDFYRRFFGNTSYYWNTFDEYLKSGYKGLIAIRSRKPGGRCDYFLNKKDVSKRLKYFKNGYHLSAQCPEQDKLVQGEVQLTSKGLYLFGSTNRNLAMRDALKNDSFHLFGFRAHIFLKSRMCPNSWEWLNELFILYPNHVIEFTTLRYCWGTVPGFNTLFWEVRNY